MKAYAVMIGPTLDIATIMPSTRGAIINFLVRYPRHPILSKTRDQFIFGLWDSERPRFNARVVEVMIEPVGEMEIELIDGELV